MKPLPPFHSRLAFAALLLAAAPAHAGNLLEDFQATTSQGKPTSMLDIDNDTLLMNRNDGFYTSGLRYSRRYTRDAADGAAVVYGWRIGQDLYTASDIKLPAAQVGPPDHPYAGWLYAGMFQEQRNADGSYRRLGIDIGCLGPCAGGDATQTGFHRLLNQVEPVAWSSQVRNEWGAILHAELAPVRWSFGRAVDLTPHIRARFGNIHTDLGAGVLLRAGRLNLQPDQPTLHGYLKLNGRAVGYDATLQGGYFSHDNPHTVKPKRFTGDAEIGLAWQDGDYGASIALVRRGNEIRGLPDSIGAQKFVRLQFSWTPD